MSETASLMFYILGGALGILVSVVGWTYNRLTRRVDSIELRLRRIERILTAAIIKMKLDVPDFD